MQISFPRYTYADVMNRFGSDKPDLRYGLEFADLTILLGGTDVKIFRDVIAKKGVIKGLKVSEKIFRAGILTA